MLFLVELDDADEVDLDVDERDVLGRQRRCVSTPTMAKAGRGISMIRPSARLTSVGVPQPSFAIGPIRKGRPSAGRCAAGRR